MHKQILKRGHNSARKGRIKKSYIYTQLRTMGDNPRRFQGHPLKNVGGFAFKGICYRTDGRTDGRSVKPGTVQSLSSSCH